MTPTDIAFQIMFRMKEVHGHDFLWQAEDIGLLTSNLCIFEFNGVDMTFDLADALVNGTELPDIEERIPFHLKLVNDRLDRIYEQCQSPLQVPQTQA